MDRVVAAATDLAVGPAKEREEVAVAIKALATEPSLTTVARDNRLHGDEVRVIRTTVVAGAIALALACAGPAGAASPYDFAVGGGSTAAGDQFGFSAHDGPTGPSGHVTYSTATFDV